MNQPVDSWVSIEPLLVLLLLSSRQPSMPEMSVRRKFPDCSVTKLSHPDNISEVGTLPYGGGERRSLSKMKVDCLRFGPVKYVCLIVGFSTI